MKLKVCSVCKQEKLTTQFNKNKGKKDGLQTHCKLCSRERFKAYYESNTSKHKSTTRKRKLRTVKANAQYIWDYLKQNPCKDCGESNPVVLEFDHVRGKKRQTVGLLIHRGNSLKTIMVEIAKCDVRCSNCHRKKTAIDFNWYKNIIR